MSAPASNLTATPWVAICANPGSGSGPNRRHVDELAREIETVGLEARVIWRPAEQAEEFRNPQLRNSCCCVVAAGGDGTVNRVLGADLPAPLAVLPLGTENLFARHHRFTLAPRALARRIADGRTHRIDLARAGERTFSLMLSAGFDGEVIQGLDRWRTETGTVRRVRHTSYFKPVLRTLRTYRFPRVQLETDGQQHEGTLAMVFNHPVYALMLGLHPAAEEDDGLLDWFIFDGAGLLSLTGFLMDVLQRKHLHRADVRHGRARQITLASAGQGVPIQLDGEAAGSTPVEIRIVPDSLEVIR